MPKKLLSVIALIVLLFTQTTGLYAAENNSGKSTAGNVYNDPNNTTIATTGSGTQTSFNNVADSLANYYINYWKDSSWDWLRRTQFSGSFMNGSSPQWMLSTIQPFNNIDNSLDKVWYGSGSYSTNTSTMNLGIGYRRMNDKHSSVYGANLFYDNQFNVSDLGGGDTGSAAFQRVGLGLEYFTGPLEATVNGYLGISAPVMVANNTSYQTWQNVANGYDINLKSNLSYFRAPWLSLTLTGYQYFGSQSNSVMANDGHWAGLAAQLGWQVTPQLTLSVGRDFGLQSTTASFNFNLLAAPQPATFLADPVINNNSTKDLSYKMLQQPQRSSTIAVEQYTKQNGFTVALTFVDDNGQPLVNMPVTLTPRTTTSTAAATAATGSNTTFTAVTSGAGIAIFNYVTAGDWAVGIPSGYTALIAQWITVSGQLALSVMAVPVNPAKECEIDVISSDAYNLLAGSTITVNGVYVKPDISGTGWFVYEYLPAGTYTGVASCPGYADKTFTFTAVAGKEDETYVYLDKTASKLTLTPASATVNVGDTQQYKAIVTYADGTTADVTTTYATTWTSSDTTVATTPSRTVGSSKGLSAGTANITATYRGITSNAAALAVNDAVSSIAVTADADNIYAGKTQQYTATATYVSGKTGVDVTNSVTWSSDNTDAATIATGGLATGVAAGTANITATLGSVSSPAVALTVKANPVTEVAVTPATASIYAGKTQQYTAKATYTSGDIVDVTSKATWSSDSSATATISSGGLATGVAAGTANITATYDSVASSAAVLTVKANAVKSIAITPTASSISAAETQQYTATATMENGDTADITSSATWNSSNTGTATIATDGLATGVAAGTANITATSGSVTSNTATLTVKGNPVVSIYIDPSSANAHEHDVLYFTAKAVLQSGATVDVTSSTTWGSTDTNVAIVSSDNPPGYFYCMGIGTAGITAKYGNFTATQAKLTVTAYQ